VLVDDGRDAGHQAVDPPDGELGREHAADALVLGRVEGEQVAGARSPQLVEGHVRRSWHGELGRPLVGEPFVVGQHRLDVIVPCDEVDRRPERVDDGSHAGLRAHLAEFR
jgi:hypothetical protein